MKVPSPRSVAVAYTNATSALDSDDSSDTSLSSSMISASSLRSNKRRKRGALICGRWSMVMGVTLVGIVFLTVLPLLLLTRVATSNSLEDTIFVRPATRSIQHEQEDVLDVLIIGAGWSGLAAGEALHKHGIRNFEILEARDYMGGRSRTVYPFKHDLAVEMGSAWIYEDTEVYEMMLEHEVPYGEIHYDDEKTLGLYHAGHFSATSNEQRNDHVVSGEIKSAERKMLSKLWFEDFAPYSRKQTKKLRETGSDQPFRNILDKFLTRKGFAMKSKERQFLQSMVHAQIEIEYGSPLNEVSGSSVGKSINECLFCGADYYVPVQGGGFDKILAPLVAPLRPHIHLNHVVTKIEHSSDEQPARVTYVHNGQSATKLAKLVLVTVPLGVLKAKSIEFVPNLPHAKQDAIDFMGFGVLDKCVFYWETDQQDWWPAGKELLTLITDQDATSGRWTSFFNDKELGNGGHFVLSAWTGANAALALEQESDQAIVAQALANLRSMLGDQVPEPSKYLISRWGQDEFAHGSYSFNPVGRPGLVDSARRELGARVGTRLFWAGEATDEKWSGTTVGAYRSGVKVTQDILLSLGHGLSPRAQDSAAAGTVKS